MRRACFVLFLVLQIHPHLRAQDATPYRIHYSLAMPKPSTHLFEVSIDVRPGPGAPRTIEFQMARWSPGRYAVADFAKNVQEFRARAGSRALTTLRVDDQTWRVFTEGAADVRVTYNVFANDLSGTFGQLDSGHASYNGAELFMYIVGHKPDPVELGIDPPTGWKIAHGRMNRMDERSWTYPNWDILVDHPTEIGPDWTLDEFQFRGKRYRVMVHSRGPEGGKRPALIRDIEKIVQSQVAMMGDPDYESYMFLIHFAADDRSGDGMEHLTSTQIIEPGALADPGVYEDALGTVSHEFFHVWNVKRMRPEGLGPWDFTKPANTKGLWIAEGFTNYYGKVHLRRAGITDDAGFFESLSGSVTNIETAPGSRLMSAEESSLSAPFLDAAIHRQRTNLANTTFSYYPKGEILALVMDLLIRGKSGGKRSLDDVMLKAFDEFYVKSPRNTYYLQGRGYSNEDFERVASEVAGVSLSDYFTRHIRGVEPPPYDEALAYVGLKLSRVFPAFTAGIQVDNQARTELRIASIRPASSGEIAGLESGDVVLRIGEVVASRENWRSLLNRYRTGDRVVLSVRRRRETIEKTVVLGEPDVYQYRVEEIANASAEARALRQVWLAGK